MAAQNWTLAYREIEDNGENHVPDRKTKCRRKEDGRDPRSLVRFPSGGARRTIEREDVREGRVSRGKEKSNARHPPSENRDARWQGDARAHFYAPGGSRWQLGKKWQTK